MPYMYAHAILSGKKTVEFRRNGVPSNIQKIVIYSTNHDQKLLGYCIRSLKLYFAFFSLY